MSTKNRKKTLVTATFQGQDGALGYMRDGMYQLLVEEHPSAILISRPDGTGQNKYPTLAAFLGSWANLSQAGHGQH